MTDTLSNASLAASHAAVSSSTGTARRKVLHLIPGLAGGGAERFLRNLVRTMNGTRWETVVLVINVGKHQALAEELRALGCTVYDLNQPALLNPKVWLGTWKIILQEQPDIVQTWMHHADFIGGVMGWLAGVRNVIWGIRASVVWKNPEDSALKTRVFHAALKFGSRLLPRRIIGNSVAALSAHEAMGYPRRKFVWIPNGIDASRFAPVSGVGVETRDQLGIPQHAPVVGFVGRFHPLKEMALFFQVTAALQREWPDLHLVLCGGAEEQLYPEARATYDQLPRRDQVRFVPFCQEMERFYPAFDLLLMCSSAAEAFPNVVLEAMACGTRVVATAAGDAEAIIGDAGKVVPLGDAGALVASCRETLRQSAAAKEAQIQRGRDRAVNEYTLERAARRFIEVYEEVLAS